MRGRGAHRVLPGRRGGTAGWRRAVMMAVAAAVPLTAIAAAAVPASAAGGYTVTATIPWAPTRKGWRWIPPPGPST